MAIGPDIKSMTRAQAGLADIDVGLRQYMLRVYNYMIGGLVLTGAIAYAISASEALFAVVYPLRWIAFIATLGIAFFFGARITAMKAGTAQALFWVFAALMGVWISPIALIYTGASIAKVFFITAGMFGAMSLYGYTTNKSLASWGSFLFMGVIGVLIAAVVNIFLQSAALDFVLSVIGVIVFTGLTAYDTQRIKSWYSELDDGSVAVKKSIYGAFELYLDFINMFLFLLRLFGSRE